MKSDEDTQALHHSSSTTESVGQYFIQGGKLSEQGSWISLNGVSLLDSSLFYFKVQLTLAQNPITWDWKGPWNLYYGPFPLFTDEKTEVKVSTELLVKSDWSPILLWSLVLALGQEDISYGYK